MSKQEDIEISFSFTGPAGKILPVIRRLQGLDLKAVARITTRVKVPARSWKELYCLSPIEKGDATLALQQLDRLVHQRRVNEDLENLLDETISEVKHITSS